MLFVIRGLQLPIVLLNCTGLLSSLRFVFIRIVEELLAHNISFVFKFIYLNSGLLIIEAGGLKCTAIID